MEFVIIALSLDHHAEMFNNNSNNCHEICSYSFSMCLCGDVSVMSFNKVQSHYKRFFAPKKTFLYIVTVFRHNCRSVVVAFCTD